MVLIFITPYELLYAIIPAFLSWIRKLAMSMLIFSMVYFALETVTSILLGLFLITMFIIALLGNLWVLSAIHFINIVLFVMSCTDLFNCLTFIAFFLLGMYIIVGYSTSQRPSNHAYFVFYCLLMMILVGGTIEYASVTDLSWAAVIGGFSTASFASASMARFRLTCTMTEEEWIVYYNARQAAAEAKLAAEVAERAMEEEKFLAWKKRRQQLRNRKDKRVQTVVPPELVTYNVTTQTPQGGVGYNTFAGNQLPPRFRRRRPTGPSILLHERQG